MLEIGGAIGGGGPARLRAGHGLPQRRRRPPGPRRIALVGFDAVAFGLSLELRPWPVEIGADERTIHG